MKKKIAVWLFLIFVSVSFLVMPVVIAESYENFGQSLYIWRLVNEVRQNPVQSLSALGIDVNAVRMHLGVESWIIDRKLPPLALNFNLHQSAEQHNEDMINNGYIAYTSPDGEPSFEDRISSTGYDAVHTGESIGALTFATYMDSFDSAKVILVNMIKDELFADYPRNYRIFSGIFTEIGLSMRAGNISFDQNSTEKAYVVVMDFGLPVEKRSFIIGNTLKPALNGGIFDFKRGVGGVAVVFKDVFRNIEQTSVSTPALGAFQFLKKSPSPGFMLLKALNSDGSLNTLKTFQTEDKNEIYDLEIDASYY